MAFKLRALFLPALAVVALASATTAQAAYTVNTQIASVSVGGVSQTGGANFTFTTGGLTFNFNDFTLTTNNSRVIPNEIITLTGTYTGPATTLSITQTIMVTNNGVSANFTEVVNYTLDTLGLVASTPSVSPFSLTVGGQNFTIDTPQATSLDFSDPSNRTATISAIIRTSAVPEPGSIVLVGLGLVGAAGFTARRRTI